MTNQPPKEISTGLWESYQTLSEELNSAREKFDLLTQERDTIKAQLELATKKTLSPEECIEIAKAIIKYKYKGRFDLGEF